MAWYIGGVRDANKARAELMNSTTAEQIKLIVKKMIYNEKTEGTV